MDKFTRFLLHVVKWLGLSVLIIWLVLFLLALTKPLLSILTVLLSN